MKTEQTIEVGYTKGPWRIHNNIGRKGKLGIMADGAPCIIAIMGNSEAWPAEAQANAALIASSPELLELAERALFALGEFEAMPTLRSELRAAIAKAKGLR